MTEGSVGAIVTGGASGIGLATVKRLAKRGMRVVAIDLKAPPSDTDGAEYILDDVRDKATVMRAIKMLDGQVGALVLSAARGPSYDDPMEIVQTNHHAIVRNTLACCEALVEWAAVVSLSSTAAYRKPHDMRWLALANEAFTCDEMKCNLWREIRSLRSDEAYALSKWAVNKSTTRLAGMLATRRIRVNCVAAGPTKTSMSEPLWRDRPAEWSRLINESPTGTANEPDEVAAVIEWLCSDTSRMVFASFLHVDGGWRATHVG